jgi:hypothetical protein
MSQCVWRLPIFAVPFAYTAVLDGQAQADVLEVMDLEDSTGVSPNGGFFLTKSTYGGLRLVSYMQNTWSQKSKISENYDDQDALWDAFLKLGCYEGDFDIYGCPQSSVFTFKYESTGPFAKIMSIAPTDCNA